MGNQGPKVTCNPQHMLFFLDILLSKKVNYKGVKDAIWCLLPCFGTLNIYNLLFIPTKNNSQINNSFLLYIR